MTGSYFCFLEATSCPFLGCFHEFLLHPGGILRAEAKWVVHEPTWPRCNLWGLQVRFLEADLSIVSWLTIEHKVSHSTQMFGKHFPKDQFSWHLPVIDKVCMYHLETLAVCSKKGMAWGNTLDHILSIMMSIFRMGSILASTIFSFKQSKLTHNVSCTLFYCLVYFNHPQNNY